MKSFSISEVLKSSWEVFKKNWQGLYVVFLVLALLSFVPAFLSSALVKSAPAASILVSLLSWVLSLVTALGMVKVALKVVDGEKAEVADLFYAVKKLSLVGKYFLTSVVFGLVFLGAVLPIGLLVGVVTYLAKGADLRALWAVLAVVALPLFVYVSVRLQFWVYVLVDKELWGLDVLKSAWGMTKGMVLNLILFALVVLLLNVVGAFLFVLGLLITIPISMLAMATVFRKISK